jgi:hypothetical protein
MDLTPLLLMSATDAGGGSFLLRELRLALPLWGTFLVTLVIILVSAGVGFRLGIYQGRRSEAAKKVPITQIVGAMFGLLAFMLGFTFSLAASRFDAKRALVVDEANAIGTTYLRAGLLPEPFRGETRKLLREYLKARLAFLQPNEIPQGIARAEELHARLWAEAEAAGGKNPGSIIVVGLFVSSLNEVIDLHAKRVTFGLRNHIPASIWNALYFLAVCAVGMIGYHAGLVGARGFFVIIPLAIMFSVVLLLIMDLDRPQEGSLKVSQQPLSDLLNTLNRDDLGNK